MKINRAWFPWLGEIRAAIASALALQVLAGAFALAGLAFRLVGPEGRPWLAPASLLAALVLAGLAFRPRRKGLDYRDRDDLFGGHRSELEDQPLGKSGFDLETTLRRAGENLTKATGTEVFASLRWARPRENRSRWDSPSHWREERKALEGVPLDRSWVDLAQRDQPHQRIFQLDDLATGQPQHCADLDVLRGYDFKAIVAARISPGSGALAGEETPCLVVVAKAAAVFASQEISYLRSVARAIEAQRQR